MVARVLDTVLRWCAMGRIVFSFYLCLDSGVMPFSLLPMVTEETIGRLETVASLAYRFDVLKADGAKGDLPSFRFLLFRLAS